LIAYGGDDDGKSVLGPFLEVDAVPEHTGQEVFFEVDFLALQTDTVLLLELVQNDTFQSHEALVDLNSLVVARVGVLLVHAFTAGEINEVGLGLPLQLCVLQHDFENQVRPTRLVVLLCFTRYPTVSNHLDQFVQIVLGHFGEFDVFFVYFHSIG